MTELDVIGSILTSEYVQLSLLIVLIGVGIRTWAGLIGKSLMDVNVNRVVFTFVVSLLTSINVVMPVLQQIDPTANPEVWFVALIGAVLTVVGSDSVGKAVMKQVKAKTTAA